MATFEDKDTGWSEFVKSIQNFKKNDEEALGVGFEDPEVAKIAVFNEFGTSKIPERPFIRPTVDQNEKKYLNMMTKAADKIAKGTPADTAFMPVATTLQTDIQNAIKGLKTPPNTEQTLEEKSGANPLIDTGKMLKSVVIVKGVK